MKKTEISAIFRLLLIIAAGWLAVFLSAGRFRSYTEGIVYSVLTTALFVLSVAAVSDNRELAAERMNPGKAERWDRIYWMLETPLHLVTVVLSALDGGRFRLSPALPAAVIAAACLLYTAGQLLFIWSKRVNRFFSSVARIQSERGHSVCSDGPYRLVRHPGYAGSLLCAIAVPLMLGSLWGLLPASLELALVVFRTHREDRMLLDGLGGYREYAAKTRFRLIPFVW